MYANEPTTLKELEARGVGLRFKRGTVSFLARRGPVTSKAQVAGGLAVHRDHDGQDQLDTYTVTHVASGYAAVSCLPTYAAARGAAHVLLDAYAHWDRPEKLIPARRLAPLCRRLRRLGEGVHGPQKGHA